MFKKMKYNNLHFTTYTIIRPTFHLYFAFPLCHEKIFYSSFLLHLWKNVLLNGFEQKSGTWFYFFYPAY